MKKITIGPIDGNWQPIASNFFYAQRGEVEEFGFGRTAIEALVNLEKREASRVPAFDSELAEEIAFLALGAASYLREEGGRDLDRFGGYMGLISEVVCQAPVLMQRWYQIPQGEFAGVWLYDVTERFGREWAQALLEGKAQDPIGLLERIVSDETQNMQ